MSKKKDSDPTAFMSMLMFYLLCIINNRRIFGWFLRLFINNLVSFYWNTCSHAKNMSWTREAKGKRAIRSLRQASSAFLSICLHNSNLYHFISNRHFKFLAYPFIKVWRDLYITTEPKVARSHLAWISYFNEFLVVNYMALALNYKE